MEDLFSQSNSSAKMHFGFLYFRYIPTLTKIKIDQKYKDQKVHFCLIIIMEDFLNPLHLWTQDNVNASILMLLIVVINTKFKMKYSTDNCDPKV